MEETLTEKEIVESLDKLDNLLLNMDTPNQSTPNLSDLNLLEDTPDFKATPYTTELIEHIQQLEPSLTTEQVKELIDYVKGTSKGRPDFLDNMLTQTNEKLIEAIKLMSILQLTRLPQLFDYQNTLISNLVQPEALKDLTYDDISKILSNVNKTISDTLQLGIRISTQMPASSTPTKVEKLANALMNVPESVRDRIEEIIRSEM